MKIESTRMGCIHFIGIGGVGMSGLAEVLHAMGYQVQGSDCSENAFTQRLEAKGIPIFHGHDVDHLKGVNAVVISSAVTPDNIEVKQARRQELPVIRRAEMLAELMRLKFSVAIAGSHGKTTTTSLAAFLLETAGLDPTVINGGVINACGNNARSGKGEWIVAEADESDGSFLKLPVTIGVVTNIDPEHMEFYGTTENLEKAFLTFIQNLPFYGLGVLCMDHPCVLKLKQAIEDRRLVTYGFHPDAQIRADAVEITSDGMCFDVYFSQKRFPNLGVWKDVQLHLFGHHNVQNALAVIAVGLEVGLNEAVIRQAFKTFSGVKRRFYETGVVHDIRIIDDYAHHPVEIKAVLKTARALCSGKLFIVYQPHRYSRLAHLFQEFKTCFKDADEVMFLPVYAAGENPIPGMTSQHLSQAVLEEGISSQAVDQFEAVGPFLSTMVKPNDMILCLGAGSITNLAAQLPDTLQNLMDSKTRHAV